ncbi:MULTISPECIES: alpha/beta fold hydrolase [unclassified Nocardioides]|uniref:alpha/beta fold hydrolase n=1 Tax=unclassified Nocardioides TaxID=2615069 RepID=UPI00362166EF
MERRSVDLPAGRVHYRESGPPDGPVVVFVHGFLVDDALWADVPERVGAAGLRAIAPTWPLGSHAESMRAGADLSPRGVARVVLSLLQALELTEVTLVGNDTGGAVCQFVIDEDASLVARLVLTNCDAFEVFPPFPFDLLFRLGRRPGVARLVLQSMRPAALRNGPLGFGPLVRRRLRPEETLPWVTPYLTDAGVRRDVATFARGWSKQDLADVGTRLRGFTRPVLLCWAPADRFFRISLAHRLVEAFPDARLREVPDARTFVALDQPELLADEITAFVGGGARS